MMWLEFASSVFAESLQGVLYMTKRYLTPADMNRLRVASSPAPLPTNTSPQTTGSLQADHVATYSITSTPEPLSVNMGRRMKVYSIQMILRIACFFGFVLVDDLWWKVACVVGVVLLPWSAVMLANVGADTSERPSQYVTLSLYPELESAPVGSKPADYPSVHTTDGTALRAVRYQSTEPVIDGEWS